MKQLITYQIDSFTKERYLGNPAGVVLNADGLTDSQMQQIARELNNSETAFLFKPTSKDFDLVIRYFTPKAEVPTCGHATIAALFAKALEEKLASCFFRMKTNIGVLPVEIIKSANGIQVIMTQGKFELSEPLEAKIQESILNALGIGREYLDKRCPIQIASTGHSKVMIGIQHRELLNKLTPDFHRLAQLSKTIGCNGYFVFTFDSDSTDILTYGRMFAPAIGVQEDPVTGNANGPLGGYLVCNHLIDFSKGSFEFSGCQGETMGRKGIIHVQVKVKDNYPEEIKIKGDAVVVFKTMLEI